LDVAGHQGDAVVGRLGRAVDPDRFGGRDSLGEAHRESSPGRNPGRAADAGFEVRQEEGGVDFRRALRMARAPVDGLRHESARPSHDQRGTGLPSGMTLSLGE
jgi:hypothetical protein